MSTSEFIGDNVACSPSVAASDVDLAPKRATIDNTWRVIDHPENWRKYPTCKTLKTLEDVARSVEHLTLNVESIGTLAGAPPGLKTLKVTFNMEINLQGCPPGLETLIITTYRDFILCNVNESLQHLALHTYRLQTLGHLPPSLQTLELTGCKGLYEFQSYNPEALASIRSLVVKGCPTLRWQDNLPPNVESLHIERQVYFWTLKGLHNNIRELSIVDCANFHSFDGVPDSLRVLTLAGFNRAPLVDLPANLEELTIENCRQIKKGGDLPRNLVKLTLKSCKDFQSLRDAPVGLTHLHITRSKGLLSMPHFPGLESLTLDHPVLFRGKMISTLEEYRLAAPGRLTKAAR